MSTPWYQRIAGEKYTFLLVALLVLFLAPLIVGTTAQRSLVFGGGWLVVLVFGVFAVARQGKALFVAILLGVPATLAQVSSFIYGTQHYPQIRLALFVAFLSFTSVIIVRDVLGAEAVTWNQIQGAVCAYLFVGLTWALLYAWVGIRDPQAFGGAVTPVAEYPGEPMVYYSFVTLTTLGYGDIAPLSHTARTLSWLEATFGQIYLVVLVARLVSLHVTGTADGESE